MWVIAIHIQVIIAEMLETIGTMPEDWFVAEVSESPPWAFMVDETTDKTVGTFCQIILIWY